MPASKDERFLGGGLLEDIYTNGLPAVRSLKRFLMKSARFQQVFDLLAAESRQFHRRCDGRCSGGAVVSAIS